MDLGFRMHAERTPNPNSVKWVLSQPVAGIYSANFADTAPAPDISPLAARLFEVEGVSGVYLGPDFVTVSKQEEKEWADLAAPIVVEIKAWVATGAAALGEAWEPPDFGEASEIVEKIREILDRDVRPYVAQDGGEISFAGYRDGVVEVYLRGSCAGCPSSTITLKMGIEARLKEEVPEVTSVVAL
jgi:Fe-S cluster biogenesis protein NfuA